MGKRRRVINLEDDELASESESSHQRLLFSSQPTKRILLTEEILTMRTKQTQPTPPQSEVTYEVRQLVQDTLTEFWPLSDDGSAARQGQTRVQPAPPSTDKQSKIDSEIDQKSSSESIESSANRRLTRQLSCVSIKGPALALPAYLGWQPPEVPVNEADVVCRLLDAINRAHSESVERPKCTYFRLDDFSIYSPPSTSHGHELVTLDRLSRDGFSTFLFDGILSVENESYYLQGVPFKTLTIDGYGDLEVVNLQNSVCIQSPIASSQNAWYQLGIPSPVYARFYRPFLWLAHFAKYFVDYLLNHSNITMRYFRRNFYDWMHSQYNQEPTFNGWLSQCNLHDFRTTVAANVEFLWKECSSIDNPESTLCLQPIWNEVHPQQFAAIPKAKVVENMTIVTPYAYQLFGSMYFGHHLQKRSITDSLIERMVTERKTTLRLTPYTDMVVQTARPLDTPIVENTFRSLVPSTAIEEGDVVAVLPDRSSRWKSKAEFWYAYVQGVRVIKDRTVLDVLWLYEPADTTIGTANYPFTNELFLSDNCSCGKKALDSDSVVGKVTVSFFVANPFLQRGFFVRQKFRTVHEDDTYDFMQLQTSDMKCGCNDKVPIFEECHRKYSVGDTVLILNWSEEQQENALEPAQIVGFDYEGRRVRLRRLERRSRHDSMARPNELVLTTEILEQPPSKIVRHCYIRTFERSTVNMGELPPPYDQNGAGDFYFICRPAPDLQNRSSIPSSQSSDELEDMRNFPPIKEAWNPNSPSCFPKLNGMGIFCGGGNLDRGLEEGGAVKFRYAIDWDVYALYSNRLNAHDPEGVNYFLGSVDDYLALALKGSRSGQIARPGDVDVLSAGSPCPGFSLLQPDKLSELSKRNASMVASVVSYVDHYSPAFFLLENVVNMTTATGPGKNENVFSQILAALVGLGYQVQQFLGDSWSYGSCQQRTRLFILASAPGLPPLPLPQQSHSHPESMELKRRCLGTSTNGKSFGQRRDDYTPFGFTSAYQGLHGLPDIGDAQVQLCPECPDHRTGNWERQLSRSRIAVVPVFPRGMGLVQARDSGLLRGEPLEFTTKGSAIKTHPKSKAYSRIDPEGPLPTITTAMHAQDGKNGRVLHWAQHRLITVAEAKRAQGYRDEEVLVGGPREQMKTVGNSVDRKLALVLGLSLRSSWIEASLRGILAYSRSTEPQRSQTSPSQSSRSSSTDNTAGAYDSTTDEEGYAADRASPIVLV